MSRPYGPHVIGPKRQVSIPADVLRALKLGPGDEVYFQVTTEPQGCVLVVPVEVADRWWSRGQALEGPSEPNEPAATTPESDA